MINKIKEALGSNYESKLSKESLGRLNLVLNQKKKYDICAFDGGARPNPGKTYSAWVINQEDYYRFVTHEGTNNIGELDGCINLLRAIRNDSIIFGDSSYVINMINKEWLENWVCNKSINSRPNSKLLKELYELIDNIRYEIHFIHVPAHVGIPINERVDKLTWEALGA